VAVVLLLYPLEGILASLAAIGVIWLSRYVSLGSLTYLIVSAVMLMLTRGPVPHGLWAVILLALGIFQHRSNIQRLVRGKENKFSLKRPQSPGVNTPG
jgi:glycerol-3-phosphate acyltransferase PlsY